jgi:hypothetical protein
MRLCLAKSIASDNELRRRHGHGRDSQFLQGRSEEASTEALPKRSEPVVELTVGDDKTVERNLVKKVAAEELNFAADAQAVFFPEAQIVKDFEMKMEDALSFPASTLRLASSEIFSDGKKTIGDTLHGRDHHGDFGRVRSGTDKRCGMKHTVCAEKRAAAKLKDYDSRSVYGHFARRMRGGTQRGGTGVLCCSL